MKSVLLPLLFLTVTITTWAFTPEPGQIARFQPMMRKLRKTPFLAKGIVSVKNTKLNYELRWFAPKSYQITIRNVPSSFSTYLGTSSGDWIMKRHDDNCALQAGGQLSRCSMPHSWAYLELMGDPIEAPAALEADGFFSPRDRSYSETNSKNPPALSSESARVTLEIGRNGIYPKAVLQILGPSYSEASNGMGAPLARFDQSFLAPLLMKQRYEGEVYTIEARSNLVPGRKYPRFQPILSEKLSFFKNENLVVVLNRTIDEEVSAKSVGSMSFSSGQVSVDALRSQLTASGELLLNALLLSH